MVDGRLFIDLVQHLKVFLKRIEYNNGIEDLPNIFQYFSPFIIFNYILQFNMGRINVFEKFHNILENVYGFDMLC